MHDYFIISRLDRDADFAGAKLRNRSYFILYMKYSIEFLGTSSNKSGEIIY